MDNGERRSIIKEQVRSDEMLKIIACLKLQVDVFVDYAFIQMSFPNKSCIRKVP